MDEEQFRNLLLEKLDKMMRLQAIGAVSGLPQEKDKIKELDAAGFKPTEIDRFLGKTAGYSRVVIERLKKEKPPRTTSKSGTPSTATTASTTPTSEEEAGDKATETMEAT